MNDNIYVLYIVIIIHLLFSVVSWHMQDLYFRMLSVEHVM